MSQKILVTGASGQLGRLVVNELLATHAIPDANIAIMVRDKSKVPEAVARLAVDVRVADFGNPDTLRAALQGIEKVLLISSNAVGHRAAHHKAVIDAAKKAGDVKLFAYTSILKASESQALLAKEHKETEEAIKSSGLPYVFLRNGWYTENLTQGAAGWKASGLILSAGKGTISGATRQDYAAAAAAVLSPSYAGGVNKVYELAGDETFTCDDMAAEASKYTDSPIKHQVMSPDEYVKTLVGFGLPEELCQILADMDEQAEKNNALQDNSHDLSKLIGRQTTPWQKTVETAFA